MCGGGRHSGDGFINYDEFVDALARDTVAPDAMGKRGMQSDEAMGVSAFALLEEQLGHKKVENFKMPGYIEKEKAEKKPAPPSTPQRRAPRPQPVSAKHADLLAQGYTEAQIEDMKRLTDQTSNALNQRYSNMRAAFHYVDVDNNGVVSQKEIERALKMWNISLEPGKVEMIMKQCDRDGAISAHRPTDARSRTVHDHPCACPRESRSHRFGADAPPVDTRTPPARTALRGAKEPVTAHRHALASPVHRRRKHQLRRVCRRARSRYRGASSDGQAWHAVGRGDGRVGVRIARGAAGAQEGG